MRAQWVCPDANRGMGAGNPGGQSQREWRVAYEGEAILIMILHLRM